MLLDRFLDISDFGLHLEVLDLGFGYGSVGRRAEEVARACVGCDIGVKEEMLELGGEASGLRIR